MLVKYGKIVRITISVVGRDTHSEIKLSAENLGNVKCIFDPLINYNRSILMIRVSF